MDITVLNDYKGQGRLYCQSHPTLPLIIWNYTPKTQYEQFWDEITLICRGLVTDLDGNIVSRGFPKFFNIEENRHIPSDKFEVFEKLDGQYIGVFWYNGEMVVNSRGSFTSKYAIEARRILDEKYPKFLQYSYASTTYCFELIGFEQIVISYPEPDLILTGRFQCVDNVWSEINLYSAETHRLSKIKVVQCYSGFDYKNIKHLNWQNSEGFVVRFSNGDRCKIKFEDYIELHEKMTNLSTTAIWEALKDGRPISTILNDVPDEFYDKIHEYENFLREQYAEIEDMSKRYFNYFKPWLDYRRKFFVQKIENLCVNPYKTVMMYMIDNKFYDEFIWDHIRPKFEKL